MGSLLFLLYLFIYLTHSIIAGSHFGDGNAFVFSQCNWPLFSWVLCHTANCKRGFPPVQLEESFSYIWSSSSSTQQYEVLVIQKSIFVTGTRI